MDGTSSCNFFSFLRDQLLKELEGKQSLTETKIKQSFTDLVRIQLKDTKESQRLAGFSLQRVKRIRTKYRSTIASARRTVFEKLPLSQLTQRSLAMLAGELLTRRRLFEGGGMPAGLVISGFGEKDHFPALVAYATNGMLDNQPLYFEILERRIGEDTDAFVIPFAQKEMVQTFMDGIDPDLESVIEQTTMNLFKNVSTIILDEVKKKYPIYGKKLQTTVDKGVKKILADLHSQWRKVKSMNYSNPVMEMVSALPKDELGAMAESLVNLTKFKRRISKQQESVGGPIDVAVITKGDGFVWMKRKHYFDEQLNPRFFARIHKEHSK
jgi:hypothetical protein